MAMEVKVIGIFNNIFIHRDEKSQITSLGSFRVCLQIWRGRLKKKEGWINHHKFQREFYFAYVWEEDFEGFRQMFLQIIYIIL